ncbi:MAG: CHRD domain-containing protein [Betaproteobacteria bacterium]|nr:CHRD domain-containing protein [Betaproteobacteria bacterium]
MNKMITIKKVSLWAPLSWALATLLSGCAGMGAGTGTQVSLYGAQEVPPVSTSAYGSGTIMIGDDGSISGSITTTGVAPHAAHIHMGNAGKNGPVIVPLKKTSDNVWSVPPGAKLTTAQYERYKAYGLYVNVHSPAHKGGEIRGQLGPQ